MAVSGTKTVIHKEDKKGVIKKVKGEIKALGIDSVIKRESRTFGIQEEGLYLPIYEKQQPKKKLWDIVVTQVRSRKDKKKDKDLKDFNLFVITDEKLGAGGQGTVFKGQNIETNQAVAIKIHKYSMTFHESLKREIRNLRIVGSLIGTQVEEKIARTIMEIVRGTNGLTYLYHESENKDLPTDNIEYYYAIKDHSFDAKTQFTLGALNEVISLLRKGLAHGDIRPANFLVTGSSRPSNGSPTALHLKLIDLGSAMILDAEKCKEACKDIEDLDPAELEEEICHLESGTAGYTAPELLVVDSDKEKPVYTFACDLFSLGVSIAESWLGAKDKKDQYQRRLRELHAKKIVGNPSVILSHDDYKALLPEIFDETSEKYLLNNTDHLDQDQILILNAVVSLTRSLLDVDPSKRPTLEILEAKVVELSQLYSKAKFNKIREIQPTSLSALDRYKQRRSSLASNTRPSLFTALGLQGPNAEKKPASDKMELVIAPDPSPESDVKSSFSWPELPSPEQIAKNVALLEAAEAAGAVPD
ncbi:MAG: hypothetical protein ACHQJ6_08780, partial [Candidatus Berkiellales bacterium]